MILRVVRAATPRRQGYAYAQLAIGIAGLMIFFAAVLNVNLGFLDIIGQLFQKAGLVGFDRQALMAMKAVTYATNCSAYANAWNPSVASSDNWVAEKYRSNCAVADISDEAAASGEPFGVTEDGELVGKKFGDVTVQCYMAPNDPHSGCNIYNLTLPQTLEERTGALPNPTESAMNINEWIGAYEAGYGDPEYLLYYGQFPTSEAAKWDARKMSDRFSYEALAITFAFEAAAAVIPGPGGALSGTRKTISGIYSGGRRMAAGVREVAETGVRRSVREYAQAMGARVERRIGSATLEEVVEEGPEETMEAAYRQMDIGETLTREEAVSEAAAVTRYFADDASAELSTVSNRELRDALTDIDNAPGDPEDFASAVQAAWTDCAFRGSCTAGAFRNVLQREGRDIVGSRINDDVAQAAYEATEGTAGASIARNIDEYSAEIGEIAASRKVAGGVTDEDALQLGDVINALDDEIADDAVAEAIAVNLREETVQSWDDTMTWWGRAISQDDVPMDFEFATATTRRVTGAISAIARRRSSAPYVFRRHGAIGSNVDDISESTWKDMFGDTTVTTTGKRKWEYYKEAADDMFEGGERLTSRRAASVYYRGRMDYVDDALGIVGKSTREKYLDTGLMLAHAARSSTTGRLAAARVIGNAFGDDDIAEQDYKAYLRCSAARGFGSASICVTLVNIAAGHIKQHEQDDKYLSVGHQMAVDARGAWTNIPTGQLAPAANWFMPALPKDRNTNWLRDEANVNVGSDEYNSAGPSIATERRFRLASPCYADVIRVRHETLEGKRQIGRATAPATNAPAYASPEENEHDSTAYGRTTVNPREAKRGVDREVVYSSKGVYAVEGENSVTMDWGPYTSDQQAEFYYMTQGPFAFMTGATMNGLNSGRSPAPPGYEMPEGNFDTEGNVWNGFMEMQGGEVAIQEEDGYRKVAGDYQIEVLRDRVSDLLWNGGDKGEQQGIEEALAWSDGRMQTATDKLDQAASLIEDRNSCSIHGNDISCARLAAVLRRTGDLHQRGHEKYKDGVRLGLGRSEDVFPLAGAGTRDNIPQLKLTDLISYSGNTLGANKKTPFGTWTGLLEGARRWGQPPHIHTPDTGYATTIRIPNDYADLLHPTVRAGNAFPTWVDAAAYFGQANQPSFQPRSGPQPAEGVGDRDGSERGDGPGRVGQDLINSLAYVSFYHACALEGPRTENEACSLVREANEILVGHPCTGKEEDSALFQQCKTFGPELSPRQGWSADADEEGEDGSISLHLATAVRAGVNLYDSLGDQFPALINWQRYGSPAEDDYGISGPTVEDGFIPDVYGTAGMTGTKSFESAPIEVGNIWEDALSFLGFAGSGDAVSDQLEARVEGLVYHVDEKDASEVEGLPDGANYCYGNDPLEGDEGKYYLFYSIALPLEIGVAVVAEAVTPPGGGVVAEMLVSGGIVMYEQKLSNDLQNPWPYSE